MIQKESWYKETTYDLPLVGYHTTSLVNWEAIQKEGLKPGSSPVFSLASNWWMAEEGFYPSVPNFFAISPDNVYWTDRNHLNNSLGFALLEVDARGLEIWADLPSLVDHGAQVGESGELWWAEGETPEPLQHFLCSEDPDGEGSLYVDLEDRCFTLACIKITETFAVPDFISPRKIKRIG